MSFKASHLLTDKYFLIGLGLFRWHQKLSNKWMPAMAHVSSENFNLRNSFFVYCIIRKLHDKITKDNTMLMGLCKKHQDKYGFDLLVN